MSLSLYSNDDKSTYIKKLKAFRFKKKNQHNLFVNVLKSLVNI